MPHVIISNAMEAVHDQSLSAIAFIQHSFIEQKNFMVWISMFFDPRYVFLIYAPLLFALSRHVSQKLVITLTITEWSNQILKWFLAGERPYWYVHERADEIVGQRSMLFQLMPNHTALGAPVELRQFPVTCELGAGSPSGHAMVTASVWYILIDSLLKGQLTPNNTNAYIHSADNEHTANKIKPMTPIIDSSIEKSLGSKLGWTFYTIILALVSVSRVFLACHFPHQCLGGALMGLAIAKYVSESNLSRVRVHHYQYGTVFMFAAVMATFGVLKLVGFNPLWSVDKAMKWCVKPEYIHLDTTPFFSMMRYLGFCLGAGLGLFSASSEKHQRLLQLASNKSHASNARNIVPNSIVVARLVAGVVSIYFGKLLLAIPMTKSNLELFYLYSFVIYVAFACAAMGPIPYYTHKIISQLTSTNINKCR